MFGLSSAELRTLKKLSTPEKIQEYLDTLPINFEKTEETLMSPRRVLRAQRAHCMEGALLAAAALWVQGEKPLLLDLKTDPEDDEHVVALFKVNGYWGAISKTNHVTLRYRDPVYKTVRELAMSYFHEYFLNKNGKKTLRSFSRPYNLSVLGTSWVTAEDNLWHLATDLDRIPHFPTIPPKNRRRIRPSSAIERQAGTLTEWKRSSGR
ncbi:hypothetical protein K2Y00_04090 [Patescibacteria group bacterium]|nr:hypothetical protein [Patescibacteria group bacterium]